MGKAPRGTFRFKRPDELAAETIEHLLQQVPTLDRSRIDDVIVGNAMPEAEQGLNIGRLVSLMGIKSDEIAVVSPDEGSIKRAVGHSKRLGGCLAIVDKRRTSASVTRQENIIGGPIEGRIALMFDDMISTAGSICGAAELVHEAGAREIYVAATHGVLSGEAVSRLRDAPIKQVILTDTIPLAPEQTIEKFKVLSVAPLLGEAIKRIHHDESISEIFQGI